jgi:hypothetical protein
MCIFTQTWHTPPSNGLFVMAFKRRDKHRFRTTVMSLVHIGKNQQNYTFQLVLSHKTAGTYAKRLSCRYNLTRSKWKQGIAYEVSVAISAMISASIGPKVINEGCKQRNGEFTFIFPYKKLRYVRSFFTQPTTTVQCQFRELSHTKGSIQSLSFQTASNTNRK